MHTRVVTVSLLIMIKHPPHLFTRAAEHIGISNLSGEPLKSVKQSEVSEHLLECTCSKNFDHFDILLNIL